MCTYIPLKDSYCYGADCFNGTNSYVIVKGQSRLVILTEDETVSSIRYEAILD